MDGKSLLIRYTADMRGNQAPVALWLTPEADQTKVKADFSFMNCQFEIGGLASRVTK
jgi:hypothetical protein